MSAQAWATYAEQLAPLGYGYPLWHPEPTPGIGETQLGDVGWIAEGAFHPLFNALRGADDNQPRGKVPYGYAPLTTELIVDGPREVTSQDVLCSRSIRKRNVTGALGAGGTSNLPSSSLELSFSCRDDSGAILVPRPSVVSHQIMSKRHIVNYVHANIDSWISLANENLGLDLKEEDIRFVCGTKKTARWAVAAFHGNYRDKSGSLLANLGIFPGSASLTVQISDECLSASQHRTGPRERTCATENPLFASGSAVQASPSETSSDVFDQCVFIVTYKCKRKLPIFRRSSGVKIGVPPDGSSQTSHHSSEKTRATTKPRDGGASRWLSQILRRCQWKSSQRYSNTLPSQLDSTYLAASLRTPGGVGHSAGDGMSTNSGERGVQGQPHWRQHQVVDVLDSLLDYILENSDAQCAVGSETDLYSVIGQHEMPMPKDLRSALAIISPGIDVDREGVGTIRIQGSGHPLVWGLGATGESEQGYATCSTADTDEHARIPVAAPEIALEKGAGGSITPCKEPAQGKLSHPLQGLQTQEEPIPTEASLAQSKGKLTSYGAERESLVVEVARLRSELQHAHDRINTLVEDATRQQSTINGLERNSKQQRAVTSASRWLTRIASGKSKLDVSRDTLGDQLCPSPPIFPPSPQLRVMSPSHGQNSTQTTDTLPVYTPTVVERLCH